MRGHAATGCHVANALAPAQLNRVYHSSTLDVIHVRSFPRPSPFLRGRPGYEANTPQYTVYKATGDTESAESAASPGWGL